MAPSKKASQQKKDPAGSLEDKIIQLQKEVSFLKEHGLSLDEQSLVLDRNSSPPESRIGFLKGSLLCILLLGCGALLHFVWHEYIDGSLINKKEASSAASGGFESSLGTLQEKGEASEVSSFSEEELEGFSQKENVSRENSSLRSNKKEGSSSIFQAFKASESESSIHIGEINKVPPLPSRQRADGSTPLKANDLLNGNEESNHGDSGKASLNNEAAFGSGKLGEGRSSVEIPIIRGSKQAEDRSSVESSIKGLRMLPEAKDEEKEIISPMSPKTKTFQLPSP
ncbi:MAG: hypothetical protein HQL32_09035 [Planctomycetes bacterium]|nr:hypothetical protein [Planctomycetota bacterium]